jgi:CRP/FNR family cyclic AMP-dependent transcriptional regulator
MILSRARTSELIATTPLFVGVAPEDLEAIVARAIEVDFPDEAVIARQGEIGTGLFIVVTGAVQVVRDGRVLARLGPGDFFGEYSVLDGRPRTAQVAATRPTRCLALATWDLEAIVTAHPRVALAILRGLAGRLRTLTEAERH